jgi:hypothetical protein
MSTFNVELLITWAEPSQKGQAVLDAQREQLLSDMVAAGKTDGVAYAVSDTITRRQMIDAAAAQEYADWLVGACANAGIPGPVSTQIIVPTQP